MKKTCRFIVPLAVTLLITVLFPLATFAMKTEYTILYYTSTNKKEKVGQDDCDNAGKNPRGFEVDECIGDYQFDKWVVEGNESGGLPTGWTTQNNGMKPVYNPATPGAELDSFHFIAVYKPYVEPVTKSEEPTTTEEIAPTVNEEITENPTTGDTNSMTVWFIIGGVAVAAIIVAVIFLVRKK